MSERESQVSWHGLFRRPNKNRHIIGRIDQRSRARAFNSVVEAWVDLDEDADVIAHGEAERVGNNYVVRGRTYGVKPEGTIYPISGPGVHRLNRGAFRALGVYNTYGLTDEAERILDLMGILPESREAARAAYLADRGA